MTTSDGMNEQQLALAKLEYGAIKTEQAGWIGGRDSLVYTTLAAIAGVLYAVHSARDDGYLLLVPPVAFILGWTYLRSDVMVSAIGRYFREHQELPGLGWEREHHADKRGTQRKIIQFAVDLMTFCGSGLVALVAFWAAPYRQPTVLVLASAAEAIAVGVLAWQFTVYADVAGDSRKAVA